jgi:hypothetical protein
VPVTQADPKFVEHEYWFAIVNVGVLNDMLNKERLFF